jgi:putative transposon-encoded protein
MTIKITRDIENLESEKTMSRQKPIKININKHINITPEQVYESTVTKSGNGAVIKSFKKYIGKEVIVIVKKKIKRGELTKEEYSDLADASDY